MEKLLTHLLLFTHFPGIFFAPLVLNFDSRAKIFPRSYLARFEKKNEQTENSLHLHFDICHACIKNSDQGKRA